MGKTVRDNIVLTKYLPPDSSTLPTERFITHFKSVFTRTKIQSVIVDQIMRGRRLILRARVVAIGVLDVVQKDSDVSDSDTVAILGSTSISQLSRAFVAPLAQSQNNCINDEPDAFRAFARYYFSLQQPINGIEATQHTETLTLVATCQAMECVERGEVVDPHMNHPVACKTNVSARKWAYDAYGHAWGKIGRRADIVTNTSVHTETLLCGQFTKKQLGAMLPKQPNARSKEDSKKAIMLIEALKQPNLDEADR